MKEIELKFLINHSKFSSFFEQNPVIETLHLKQAYIAESSQWVTRIRITDNKTAIICIKSREDGISRDEFEYEIPLEDGLALYENTKARIEKIRRLVRVNGLVWEIDEFLASKKGLWLAEVEIPSEDHVVVPLDICEDDVSKDRQFSNHFLSTNGQPI